jgi:hypothetical protein
MKGNIMSNRTYRKPAVADVPGLAYFTAEAEKPGKTTVPQPRTDLGALDQMYGYFAA